LLAGSNGRQLFNPMQKLKNKQKIMKVSRIIRHLLFAGLVVWVVTMPAIALPLIFYICDATRLPSLVWSHAGTLVMSGLCFLINLGLFRFFDRLKDGHLFDAVTVSHLSTAGKWWIVLSLFSLLYGQVGVHWLGFPAPACREDIFPGLALLFVAWLLKEAQGLQEEQELTV